MAAGQIPPGDSRLLGTTLSDRYVLRSVLGRGAFATTFLADDERLNLPVVIKLLGTDGPEAIELFRKEIVLTRGLEHPNIVRALDAVFRPGQTYSVTEWIDGKDLGEILDRAGPLGTSASLQVATGIAETLAYVHGKGHLHRDLKPSNVLIPGWPSAPKYRNPKILDFGVAGRLFDGHTQLGAVFGTPRYMSPEQLRGEAQTPATDVYGLGLLLFEMLTGNVPQSRAGEAMSLFRAILEEELPEQEVEGIQPELAKLIRRCLRRKPEERPSIQAVIEELERLQTPHVEATRIRAAAAESPQIEGMTDEMAVRPSTPVAKFASRKLVWLIIPGAAVVAVVLVFFPFPTRVRGLIFVGGLLLMLASIVGGLWLRKWLGRNSTAKEQAYDLALGAKARVDLTATIALQLDDLVTRLRGLDEKILAGTVALMLDEYGRATEAKDRQSALMNVVTLSEKLTQRLSPWYVRYKDAIASAVAVLGAVSGLLAAITSLLGVHKH